MMTSYISPPLINPLLFEQVTNRGACKYKCRHCPKSFKAVHGVKAHLESPAHQARLYECPSSGCQDTFPSLSGLLQHLEGIGKCNSGGNRSESLGPIGKIVRSLMDVLEERIKALQIWVGR